MSSYYNETISWTSPLINYSPEGAWQDARLMGQEGTMTYSFYGPGVIIYGIGSPDSYDISLDGVDQPDYKQRFYTAADMPSGFAPQDGCDGTTPGRCVALAEFWDLDPKTKHTVVFKGRQKDLALDVYIIIAAVDTGLSTFSTLPYKFDAVGSNRISFEGGWEDTTTDSGAKFKTSQSDGDSATFKMKAYSIFLYGSTTQGETAYDVTFDGETSSIVPSGKMSDANALFFFRTGLDQTQEHTLVVTNKRQLPLALGFVRGVIINELPSAASSVTSSSADIPVESKPPSDGDKNGSGGLGTGAIAGLAVAAVALIAFVILGFWFLRRRRQQQRQYPVAEPLMPNVSEVSFHPGRPTAPITPFRLGPSTGSHITGSHISSSAPFSSASVPAPYSMHTGSRPNTHYASPSEAGTQPTEFSDGSSQHPASPQVGSIRPLLPEGAAIPTPYITTPHTATPYTVAPYSATPYSATPYTPPATSEKARRFQAPIAPPPGSDNGGAPAPPDDEEQVNRILQMLARRMGEQPVGDQPPSYRQ